MWETIKKNFARGFGLSFGGALGWRLGNFVANLIGKAWKWLLVSIIGFAAGVGIPNYANEHAQSHQQVQTVQQIKQHH